jgi:cytoskeletal protein RodZ
MKETTPAILTQQQENLSKIGAYLQQIRLAKGCTLAWIARKTKIRVTLLRNIEEGNLLGLPEPVYLKGLINRYAEGLGLDGQAIAASFPLEDDLRKRWQLPSWGNFSLQFNLRPVHLYVVYLVVIVTTVQSLSNVLQTPVTTIDPQLQPEGTANPQPVTKAIAPSPAKLIAAEPTPEDNSVVIDIQTQDSAWMRVDIDGKTAFEGTVPKGTQKQWVVDESITIKTGNAGAVMITINNEAPHPLGEPGAVEEFTYQALAEDGGVAPRTNS